MNKKTTLTEEAFIILKELIYICEKTNQGDKCYIKLNRIRKKAVKRWERRHKKALESGKETIVNKVGRPKKEDKKAQINVKLPPWLNEWMKKQPESKAVLIETALISYYQIPKGVQEENK